MRYTLGKFVREDLYHLFKLYQVLDNGVVTDAHATQTVSFSDECEITGGLFLGGTFYSGEFHGGIFNDGEFDGGEFAGGTYNGGTFDGGEFVGGTYNGGIFRGGSFLAGIFNGGVIHDGLFLGGVFDDLEAIYTDPEAIYS